MRRLLLPLLLVPCLLAAAGPAAASSGDDVQARYRHTTPYYDVVVLTSPARIESLAIDPSGRGRHRGVVSNYARKGSAPYVSYGGFSSREDLAADAGRPVRALRTAGELRLEDIPVGDRGIRLDWTFRFHERTFDVELDWDVGEPQQDVWELGWKLDTIARHAGTQDDPDLPGGDRGPYTEGAHVLLWEDDPRYAFTLVTAFAAGSADRGDNVFLELGGGRPVTWAAWQTVWRNGGTSLPAGPIRGGRWRIGASGAPRDAGYGAALADAAGGGAAATPDPGPDDEFSARERGREFAARLGPPHGGGRPRAERHAGGAVTLSDGCVATALVPAGGGRYEAYYYAAAGSRWRLAAAAGPTRRFTAAAAAGDALLVSAEGVGWDGRVRSRSDEHWTIRSRPCRVHVESTDTPVAGGGAPPMHTVLAYPGEASKHEVADYDVVASPHLRPQADLVIGQHTMWSPALAVQEGAASVALVPDLLAHRRHGHYGPERSSRYYAPALDLDVHNRLVDAPVLGFGWRSTEGVYGYYWRDLPDAAPERPVPLSYDVLVRADAPERSVVSDTQRLLWDGVGHRYFEQSRLPQTQPADRAFEEAWSHWEPLYGERVVDGERRGAVRIDREFPPDIMFMSWFNALRTSYGLYSQGVQRGDAELRAKGRATLDLLLSAPREQGAFGTVVGLRDGGFEWFGSQKNYANQMPWGPRSYATFDMGWAAYWVLRWHQDLEPDARALAFARSYGDFLLGRQLPSGAVPSWIAQGTLAVDPHLRESAQTATSVLFLAELAKVTGAARYREAAERAADYVWREHHLEQRWDDFEPYYSNAPKAEGASDPISGQQAQNTLAMHFAGAGMLTLGGLAPHSAWLERSERVIDYTLQYQAVWPASFLSMYTFGGFSVQNGDQEWLDARQSQIGLTLLDLARATGRAEYAERGIAAVRAGYATMASPSAEIINPKFFDAYPVGRGPENYAHSTYDEPAGYTAFDWGQGSAAAGFAEARNRFGDVWVDGRHGRAYGIDDVHVESMRLQGANLDLELSSPSPGHRVLLKADGLRTPQVHLRVGGEPRRTVTREQLEQGVEVATAQDVRIVHNPARTEPAIAGAPFELSAAITDDDPVRAAAVRYRSGGGAWAERPLAPAGGDRWTGTIPGDAIVPGRPLEYHLTAASASDRGQAPEVDPEQVPFVQEPVEGRVVERPGYRLVVTTAPEAAIASLEVDPDGDGTFRRVLDSSARGTLPYLAVGGFGATDRPGAAASVEATDDRIVLRGIPLGDEPVTADWTFELGDETFDAALEWHVRGALNAPAWEVAWSWDTTLPRLGDPDDLERPGGDVRGFPAWTIAHDDELTLAAAYRPGSAWSEDNHWFGPGGSVSWQPLWQPGGRAWPPGDYAGGAWRIGASDRPADAAFADGLWEPGG